MNLAVRSILGILAVSVLAHPALANYNATATSAFNIQQPKKEGRRWSGYINASRSSSLVDFQDGTRQESADYLTRFSYKFTETYGMRLQGGYSQDMRYSENSDFADTSLSLTRTPGKVGSSLLLGYRVSAVAPTSKDSYKRQSLQTALSTTLVGMINPERLVPSLEISGSVSLGRNIHQFETALDGRVNNQYSSAQALSISYGFKYGISISGEFVHKNAWSYQNVMRDSFEMSQELGFEINPSFAVAVGHTNSGSSLRPNGNDSNVQIIDEKTSILYGSLTATF
ncbi:hypothetical protein AZI86_02815 [Bdellovibrio bacteriovorus]|uniref:Uncharacterized protein n=1 Tax=Bdellovibrio bacteriovorus TaxID=959 RepID=A0A150WNY6_BDEBC|nr:hypothetical protein [Bdellovibrio bacteriovorus]KYG66017.1 hypothetical protein AZI86_02815 [Bdellovibrio bacteriovorus]